jgi:hypothetical protein
MTKDFINREDLKRFEEPPWEDQEWEHRNILSDPEGAAQRIADFLVEVGAFPLGPYKR